jgi:hypothetical protein
VPWHDSYSLDGTAVDGAFRMGLRPIPAAAWLPPVEDAAERLADRARLLAENEDAYLVCPRDAVPAVQEVLELVAGPAAGAEDETPLHTLARLVPDDLCLLSPDPPPRLRAGVLTAGSAWRLPERIGLDVTAIHAPVEGLDEALGDRMRAFLARLPVDRVFERGNWALYDDGRWDRSEGDPLAALPDTDGDDPAIAEHLWLRMERQTLRRLPRTGWIVFTIRVHRHPVTDLARAPLLAAHLRAAMASLDDSERRARRLDRVGGGLDTWLARVVEGARACA